MKLLKIFFLLTLFTNCNLNTNVSDAPVAKFLAGVVGRISSSTTIIGSSNVNPVVTLPTGVANVSTTLIPVKLDVKPSSNIAVTIATSNTNLTLSPASMTFTPENFNTPQNFTVTVNVLTTCANTFSDVLTFTLSAGATFAKTYTLTINSRTNVKCVFVTTATTTGNFGGIAQADAFCMANIPPELTGVGSGNYKAFLVLSGVRTQTPILDWVMQTGNAYFQKDKTTRIGIANSNSLINKPMENSFETIAAIIHSGSSFIGSWTNSSFPVENTNNCTNFTSTATNQHTADIGNNTTSPNGTAGFFACNIPRKFLCIEQ